MTAPARPPRPGNRQSDRPYSGMTLLELRRALEYAQKRDKGDREDTIRAELTHRGATA